jgi:CheY-like chemotaxis protein
VKEGLANQRSKTIIVAEDNVLNRELIGELLEHHGYIVLEARDGQEAFDALSRCVPDLLLADIQMPVVDGFALVRMIREHATLRTLVVVALTAYAMDGDRENALERGFDGYITKPIDAVSFTIEIARYMDCRRRGLTDEVAPAAWGR